MGHVASSQNATGITLPELAGSVSTSVLVNDGGGELRVLSSPVSLHPYKAKEENGHKPSGHRRSSTRSAWFESWWSSRHHSC